MKKHLKSIIQIWNEFELALRSEEIPAKPAYEIVAYRNGQTECCVANCSPEFAGKTVAFLLKTFSDTPANSLRLHSAIHENL